jgi:hypothetical protein
LILLCLPPLPQSRSQRCVSGHCGRNACRLDLGPGKTSWQTNIFCGRVAPWVVERLAPRSASAGSACDVIQAGATPKTMPVIIDSAKENTSAGAEGSGLMGTNSEPRNAIARILRVPRYATASPAAPPQHGPCHALRQQLPHQTAAAGFPVPSGLRFASCVPSLTPAAGWRYWRKQ